MHIVHLMANNSSVPYLNWFADEIKNYPGDKFSFVALHSSKPQMLDDMRLRGCDCYWIPFDHTKRKSNMLRILPQLVKLFKTIKPDAVNTHLFDDSLPGLLAAWLTGVKKRVITRGDTNYHWYYAKKWVWADKLNNLNATNIVAISEESKQFILKNEKADPSKVTMIHHGICIDASRKQNDLYKNELNRKYQLSGHIVIGTVARYIEWKGYRYIIEAASQIICKYPTVKFVFIGEGSQRDELNTLIAHYGLQENIILTGWIDREYIPSFFGIMDLYVHAATNEPFGFVIAEAMINGVPLVTTKTGAAADALEHKRNCYFVSEQSSKELEEGICWMLEDNRRRAMIPPQIRQKAIEMFDATDMVKNYMKLYSQPL